ncbi:MAG: hypothetical protein LAT51_01330 [Flavobacteriaceae bacterium]|nr:hypothetical protein [Flavobacteriaceae bacterium]
MKTIKITIAVFTWLISSNINGQEVYSENQLLFGIWEHAYEEDGENFIFRVMLDKQRFSDMHQKHTLSGNYELIKMVNGEEEVVYSSIPYQLPEETLNQIIDRHHVFGGFTNEDGTLLRGSFQEFHTGGSSRWGSLRIELIQSSPTPKIHWRLKHKQGLIIAHDDPNKPNRIVIPMDLILEKVE